MADNLSSLAAKLGGRMNTARWHYLKEPLTSTSWDGDSFSTTAKTLIDLSATFGVPAGVKAVLVRTACADSASSASQNCWLCLGSNNTANQGYFTRAGGLPNDYWREEMAVIPCDSNGDIYYQTLATGVGTLDIYLEIYGYYI